MLIQTEISMAKVLGPRLLLLIFKERLRRLALRRSESMKTLSLITASPTKLLLPALQEARQHIFGGIPSL